MIYLGGAWPAEYNGSLFMNNIHGARLNRDILKPSGSGFVGSHAPDFLLANDVWSQIISLKYGPDGSLFMIDWYDKNQCHHNDVNGHDRTNGRIFKVSYGPTKPLKVDLAKQATTSAGRDANLSERVVRPACAADPPGTRAQCRGEPAAPELSSRRPAIKPAIQLRILLALHAVGGLSDRGAIERKLEDPDPTIRAWTIQLATEQGPPAASILSKFAELARTDPSPLVRLYLASALQRLPLGRALGDPRRPCQPCRGRRRP